MDAVTALITNILNNLIANRYSTILFLEDAYDKIIRLSFRAEFITSQ